MFASLFMASAGFAQSNTFSLQADPSSVEVAPGHSSVVTISSTLIGGSAEIIGFDANGQPSNVTLSFTPPSVQAGSPTTLTIAANNSASLGTTATITVHGLALSDSETTTVSLRVASYLPQEEWSALASLYNATGGSAWTTKTGWDFSGSGPNGTECGWYGIECDTTPRVVAIDLQNNNLTGELPDLSAFAGLLTFGAVGNHLSGVLPASIQNLPAITQIALSNNQLSGNLDVLNGLPNLQYFGGDGNAFTGAVPQLNSMPNLMGFSVDGNQLTGWMPSLAQSSKLVYLSVSENYLSGTFPSLNALTKLRYLYISGNRFGGVMPNPPSPTQLGLGVVDLCPNFFAPINNTQWNAFLRTSPWYSNCDTDTMFRDGFGAPPSLQ